MYHVRSSSISNCIVIEYDTGTSPKLYSNLTPGTHTVNIQAMAIKLDRPLRPVTATRTFTIEPIGNSTWWYCTDYQCCINTVIIQPLIVYGELQIGSSVTATFSANKPAMFECAVDNEPFSPCKFFNYVHPY